jgi:hypothetical protein
LKLRGLLLLLLLYLTSALTTLIWALEHTGTDEEGAKGGLEVKYQNDLLSVNVVNYPLRSVLEEIIKQTGLKIAIFGPLDEKISVRIENLSLDKALSKIIGNKANFIFYYTQKVSGDIPPVIQLAEVRVYPQERRGYPILESTPPQAASMMPTSSTTAKVPLTPREKKYPEAAGEGVDKDKVGEELLNALKSRDGETRESAAYALADLGDNKAVEPLIKSLDDENPWVREGAAHALAELGDKRAVDPLIKSLSDENPWVRESAVRALGELRDEQAVESLKKLLNDEDGDVRESASEVLKEMTEVEYKGKSPSE